MAGYRRLNAQRNCYASGGAARSFSDAGSDLEAGSRSGESSPDGPRAKKRADRGGKGRTQINIVLAPQQGAAPPVGVPPGPPPGPPIIPPPPPMPMMPPGADPSMMAGGAPPPPMNTGGRVAYKRGGRVKTC